MRNMMIGVGAAVMSAAVLVFASTAAAGEDKACWAHFDNGLQAFVPVWSNGGGHSEGAGGHGDYLIDVTSTRLECEAAFDAWLAPI